MDKSGEESARKRAGGVGALRVPLDSEDEVIGRVEFHRLDDTVGGGDSGDAEVVAYGANGLVVAGVDLRLGCLFTGQQASEAGCGRDADRMGFGDEAAGGVVDGRPELGGQILIKGAVAPDVESLRAVADAKDGLMEAEGILEEKLIDCGAGGIRRAAGGDALFAKPLWVNIIAASRQEDAVGTGEESCNAVLAFMKWDKNGRGSGGLKGGEVGRERTLVVLGVCAGGLGDSDADGHGRDSVSPD